MIRKDIPWNHIIRSRICFRCIIYSTQAYNIITKPLATEKARGKRQNLSYKSRIHSNASILSYSKKRNSSLGLLTTVFMFQNKLCKILNKSDRTGFMVSPSRASRQEFSYLIISCLMQSRSICLRSILCGRVLWIQFHFIVHISWSFEAHWPPIFCSANSKLFVA